MPSKFHQIQKELLEAKIQPPAPLPVIDPKGNFVDVTPEVIEAVKEKLNQMKTEEKKKKKRDYQREYMRTYKKDKPLDETELAKKKLKRTLSKYDPALIKEVLGEN